VKRSQYSKAEDEGGQKSVFESKHKVLLTNDQWSYIRKHYRLTEREFQVGRLICQGYTSKEIAKELTVKPGTVKTHLLNIYRKAHVSSKIEMLLTFVNSANNSSVKPVAVPIVETKKQSQKRQGLSISDDTKLIL